MFVPTDQYNSTLCTMFEGFTSDVSVLSAVRIMGKWTTVTIFSWRIQVVHKWRIPAVHVLFWG